MKAPVLIDQARARRAGISSLEVANSLQAYIDGITASEYREGDQAIPIVLQSLEEERAQGSDFYDIRVHGSGTGGDVPLAQIANVRGEWDFSRVARRNQERALTVEFKHEVLKAPGLLQAVIPEIEALDLPEDYRWEVGGEIEQQAETLPKLFRYLPHCVFLIMSVEKLSLNLFLYVMTR